MVLTNSIALNDAADLLSQAVLQVVLDSPNPVDYVDMARKCAARLLKHYHDIEKALQADRIPDSLPMPLECYEGRYFNTQGNFHIEIQRHPDHPNSPTLRLAFQGLQSQEYDLRHLRENTFEWSLTEDEAARRGRYHEISVEFWKMCFVMSDDGVRVEGLVWSGEPDSEPQRFRRCEG